MILITWILSSSDVIGLQPDGFCLRSLTLLIALVLVISCKTSADVLPCSVDGGTSGSEISATVSSTGSVPLLLICTKSATSPKAMDLVITEFWNEAGSAHVDLLVPPDYKPSTGNGPFIVPYDAVIPIRLFAANLATQRKYVGRLVAMADGKEPVIVKLTLMRGASTGTLVLDRQSITLQISRPMFPWWSAQPDPSFSLTACEKSGQIAMEGITVRLEQVSKQPGEGFSLGRNAAFTVNNQAIPNLEVWPPKQSEPVRSFGPGGHAVIGMTLKNLTAGEYNASLRFQAVNSNNDDAQKLSLLAQVRDSIWWAVVLLIAAVVFSFVATKVVTSLRHRFNFLQRIHELRTA